MATSPISVSDLTMWSDELMSLPFNAIFQSVSPLEFLSTAQVCKVWNQWAQDPLMIRTHLKKLNCTVIDHSAWKKVFEKKIATGWCDPDRFDHVSFGAFPDFSSGSIAKVIRFYIDVLRARVNIKGENDFQHHVDAEMRKVPRDAYEYIFRGAYREKMAKELRESYITDDQAKLSEELKAAKESLPKREAVLERAQASIQGAGVTILSTPVNFEFHFLYSIFADRFAFYSNCSNFFFASYRVILSNHWILDSRLKTFDAQTHHWEKAGCALPYFEEGIALALLTESLSEGKIRLFGDKPSTEIRCRGLNPGPILAIGNFGEKGMQFRVGYDPEYTIGAIAAQPF